MADRYHVIRDDKFYRCTEKDGYDFLLDSTTHWTELCSVEDAPRLYPSEFERAYVYINDGAWTKQQAREMFGWDG